jgi:putative endonuclease
MFFVYVLRSETSQCYYIGSTEDPWGRVSQHNLGMSKSTRAYRPWKLVYTEGFAERSEAVRRERQIKSWRNKTYMEERLGLVAALGERPDSIGKAEGSPDNIGTPVPPLLLHL